MTTGPAARDDQSYSTRTWARALIEMRDVLCAMFARRGRSAEQANADARDTVIELANHFGGRDFYLPRGQRLKAAIRDAEIASRADGTNTQALAKEFGVTDRRIREIVTTQHRLRLAKGRATSGETP